MVLKISLVLLASGLVMSTAGCSGPMFTMSNPTASTQDAESDARACGASSFLVPGVAIDSLEIPEFSECMRSRGYSSGPA
jgi:hypothetical protein